MVNSVALLGNLGNDPEVRTLESNNKVATFSLATSETYKDKQGNKQTATEWHNVEIWGKLADVVEKYLKKGSQVYLEGKIKYKSWEKDGQKKYMTVINCNNMVMLGGKTQSSERTEAQINDLNDLPY